MQEHKNFWDKNAGRYNRFMRKEDRKSTRLNSSHRV